MDDDLNKYAGTIRLVFEKLMSVPHKSSWMDWAALCDELTEIVDADTAAEIIQTAERIESR